MFFNRARQSMQKYRTKIFRGPVRGWIRSSDPDHPVDGGAEILRNIFPTTQGGVLRKGSLTRAIISSAPRHIASFDSGSNSKLIVADDNNFYDATTPVDNETPLTPDVTGLTNGNWSSEQFTAGGGSYLMMCNGADDVQTFDGTTWGTAAITGIAGGELNDVWKFKNRLFFVQKNSFSAWYLPPLAFQGAALEIPLGAVFSLGGKLLFGCTWSLDSGAGLDDVCLFVTTEGEVAVYQGSDPSDANNWSLSGVYHIGRPLDREGWFRSGGDIMILTDEGIISVSSAVQGDRSGIRSNAITASIEEEWRRITDLGGTATDRFTVSLWHSESMLIVGLPSSSRVFKRSLVANIRTGAWAEYFGWGAKCFGLHDNRLFFGTEEGGIVEANVTGSDDGAPYQCVYIPSFNPLGSPNDKSALHCRMVAKTDNPYEFELFANGDHNLSIPPALSAGLSSGTDRWNASIWNDAIWNSGDERIAARTEWQTVNACGYALAPGVSITSSQVSAPVLEINSLHLRYEQGALMG